MSLAKFSRATAGYGSENTAASCGLARGPAWSDTAQPPSLLRKWTSLVCIPAKYEVCSSIASHLDRVSALVWARLQVREPSQTGQWYPPSKWRQPASHSELAYEAV
ncbi:hypothetical protein RhiXN_01050 [Rhizoctonia solani]|nr:uncharacterized protein RhiXN_01050 [Rhizoctonia solani]KAF8680148.1 hypothetical protein RHS04_03981 [Rhizoctonia solani]QRW19644.1 hypothetical protein RhiXN_01050 [Rhizoctonia solani]